ARVGGVRPGAVAPRLARRFAPRPQGCSGRGPFSADVNLVVLDLVVERGRSEAEQARGLALMAARVFERAEDQLDLEAADLVVEIDALLDAHLARATEGPQLREQRL